jgi:hypothetical protein
MRERICILAVAALLMSSPAWSAASVDQGTVSPEVVKELVQMAIAGGQTSKTAAKPQPTSEQVLAAKKVTQSSCEELFARVKARGVAVPGSCQ